MAVQNTNGSSLISALVTDDVLDELADRIAHRIVNRVVFHFRTRLNIAEWLDSAGAARYLGVSRKAIHHYISDRGLPSYQDEPGGKRWFKRQELDSWRMG